MTARLAAGVKVAMAPTQFTVPATGVVPGPVTRKVAAGDASVEHFIASLNVALNTCPTGTPVAALVGTVEMIAGGGVIVVKVHT